MKSLVYRFSGSNDIDRVAWHDRIGDDCTKDAGLKAPNQLGLYDMSGNVWEWCEDAFTKDVKNLPSDGAPYRGESTERVLRGGCFHNWVIHCTVSKRYNIESQFHDGCIGFRLGAREARREAKTPGREFRYLSDAHEIAPRCAVPARPRDSGAIRHGRGEVGRAPSLRAAVRLRWPAPAEHASAAGAPSLRRVLTTPRGAGQSMHRRIRRATQTNSLPERMSAMQAQLESWHPASTEDN